MSVLKDIQVLDRRLLLLLGQSQSWLAQNARRVSRTADGHLYVILPLLLSMAGDAGDRLLLATALAFAAERPVYWVLKNSLRRRRPAQALPGFTSTIIASDEFSFPSGHTSAAFLFSTLLCLQFGPLALPVYGWAMAVGMSRVYLGVHFPTDTLVGAALGMSLALAVTASLT
ncbi:phosphatase PAP2 family protein [Pseudohaliea rubra]|uniref:undecaprenyl-diphosphate phosphatase n=1 Tax=Pseudohaliea rubra DSM 19751 TaxID=1265313 RepID=A0A095VR56_9GAMM|nr:phosphatase PAP2 family protein [Pseudohaliea rubra]KGE03947.1 Membrane-associated phospholipid phosphatase [Pseudohaliea rubra DSM 19751]